MSRFVIETAYHLPVYRQRIYEAETIDEACQLAIDDEGWEDEESDVEASGDTYVAGIWENAERAYEGTGHPVPEEFREAIQRKADLFDKLVALLREPAQPMGLSRANFERWLPRAQAVLAEAGAIDGKASGELSEPAEGMQ